ncbi:MAG: protein kinase [Richelia sp. SL_2_1]|nr:protein kinase [Richelia sp. SL_2_1]
MTFIKCSKGHENPPGSRFCLHCGEMLHDSPMSQSIQPGQTLGDRYLIVRQLGQGGFGRTYLAEDVNRFRELCVLKEFSPQVQTEYVLQKSEELFEREASVLYKLQHPQIPRFRELLRLKINHKEYLILVQDYVEGENYRSLLDYRLKQGMKFSETEVKQLLQQILPVLDYIHSLGVIHRDISPDNLILRKSDQLPVLIDFGGVKQVVATVASQYYAPGSTPTTPMPTLLGKVGYAPPEQMQTGLVEPHSDLYALAATVLVLLTGKQPAELIDNYNLQWQWRREVNLSPGFGVVLDKMLSTAPRERYQNANQVLQALKGASTNNHPGLQTLPPQLQPPQQTAQTVAVAPAVQSPSFAAPGFPEPQSKSTTWLTPGKIAAIFLTTVALGGLTYFAVSQVTSREDSTPIVTPTSTEPPVDPNFSSEERQRKEKLKSQREQLGIDYNFYVRLVNQIFWNRNPSLNGRTLSDEPQDADLREQWDKTASELLNKMSQLSSDARRRLGTFTAADRDRWKVQVNNINVGSRSVYDLADAPFLSEFPEQKGKNFINQPVGQVWHGFVFDKLNAVLARSAFEKLQFASGDTGVTRSGNFRTLQGKIFIAQLSKGQEMEVNLTASPKVLLSIYSPSGKTTLLEDSTRRSWSGTLDENGYYEFVIVSTSSQSEDYRLSLQVENAAPPPEPTSEPTPEPTPTEEPTPTPTEEPTPTPTEEPTPTPTEEPVPESTP